MMHRWNLRVIRLLLLSCCSACTPVQLPVTAAADNFSTVVVSQPGFSLQKGDRLYWDGQMRLLGDDFSASYADELKSLAAASIRGPLLQRQVALTNIPEQGDYVLVFLAADGEAEVPGELADLIGLSAGLVIGDNNRRTGVFILAIINPELGLSRYGIRWRGETETILPDLSQPVERARFGFLLEQLVDGIP